MLKVDPTVQTLTVAGIIAIALSVLINGTLSSHSQDKPPMQLAAETNTSAKGGWAASATGRVEPKEGEIRIVSQAAGEIVEVVAKTGDKVQAGDLIVRLDDSDAQAKLTAALSEEAVRVLERDEEVAKGPALDRRNAEDALAKAERAFTRRRQPSMTCRGRRRPDRRRQRMWRRRGRSSARRRRSSARSGPRRQRWPRGTTCRCRRGSSRR